MGTEDSLATGRFQEAKFHWPLSGNQFWKATVASVPSRDGRCFQVNARYAAGAVSHNA